MDFAQANPQGQYSLAYGTGKGPGASYVDFIMTDIKGDFESPVSKTRYRGGKFSLKQVFTGLGKDNYTVWQYYVQDKAGLPVQTGKTPETPFIHAQVVEDGFTVIWRLVEICNAIPILQADPAASATLVAQGGPYMNARLAQVVGKPAQKA